jgi:dTDP-4-dehydrorhamnose reductase
MNKNILVTGAHGQLGSSLQRIREAYPNCVFYWTDVDTLDICDQQKLAGFVHSNRIRYIINCAAYTAVDKAEDDSENCMRINRDAVRLIGEVAHAGGIKVIHVSTDYVFDGAQTRPYCEDDPTGPVSVYGQSKLEGEVVLRSVCPDAVIIRTSWLFSEYGTNFVKTMLRLGKERPELNVVCDQTGSPTYAEDLAVAIMSIVECHPCVSGVYHFSGEGVCSWYDFAVQIMKSAGLTCRVNPIKTCDYPTRAIRPAYSVLDKGKLKTTLDIQIPRWEESLEKCLHRLGAISGC